MTILATRFSPAQLPRKLADLAGPGQTPPSYRRCWQLIVDGRIPAEQVNGRWLLSPVDLPQIAAALGLTVPGDSPGPKARRAPAKAAA